MKVQITEIRKIVPGTRFEDVHPALAARAISNEYEKDLDRQSWKYALEWLVKNYKLKTDKNISLTNYDVADKIRNILEKRYNFSIEESINKSKLVAIIKEEIARLKK
jgi:hypothetical protein